MAAAEKLYAPPKVELLNVAWAEPFPTPPGPLAWPLSPPPNDILKLPTDELRFMPAAARMNWPKFGWFNWPGWPISQAPRLPIVSEIVVSGVIAPAPSPQREQAPLPP